MLFNEPAKGIALCPCIQQKMNQPQRDTHLVFHVFCAFQEIQHHLPNHGAHISAGQRVIAHECDALRREQFAAKRQQAVANRLRNPGIETVRDDVIELTEFNTDLQQIAREDADVPESELADALLAALHR